MDEQKDQSFIYQSSYPTVTKARNVTLIEGKLSIHYTIEGVDYFINGTDIHQFIEPYDNKEIQILIQDLVIDSNYLSSPTKVKEEVIS